MKKIWLVGLGSIARGLYQTLKKNHQVEIFSKHASPSFEINNELTVKDFVENTLTLPDEIIITSGLLHNEKHLPEKTLSDLEPSWLETSIKENVYPALFFLKAINQRLTPSHLIKVAIFSARVASISDNRLGGWYSYRMSKAMLNMLIKTTANEWRYKSPNSILFGYHPGTVDTRLSKPFQNNIEREKLFSVEQATKYFLSCFETRSKENSGKIYDWQGKEILP